MVPMIARLTVAVVFAATLMVVLWFRQRSTRNAGIVDVGWAGGIGLLGIFFAAVGGGHGPRRVLLGALIGAWSLRLTLYLYRRVTGESEDGRYAMLRRDWGQSFQTRIFGFYQLQAAAVVLFAAPILVGAENAAAPLGWLDGLGVLLWVAGMFGVAIADAQLARFRANPSNRGKTCREGLWSVSRHPNYFFECVLWCAYAPIAYGAPAWWVAALVPVLLLYFVTRVTGIPITEANAVASRGDDYRGYQRTVSAFIPWFPKKVAATAQHESH